MSKPRLSVGGAHAANALGLSDQVPARPQFWTSGKAHTFNIGRLRVEVRHAPAVLQPFLGTPAGTVLSALHFLGRRHLDQQQLAELRDRLSVDDVLQLQQALPRVPRWMADAIRQMSA